MTTQSLPVEVVAARSTAPVWRRVLVRAAPTDRESVLAWALLAFAVGFNAWYLHAEVAIHAHKLNDGVLHMMALRGAVDAMRNGRDPTDFWFAPVATGFPLFHHYQHLPFLPPALLFLALRDAVGLTTIFDWTQYLLLSLFPLSIYWAMRRFGFARLTAALAGAVAPLVSTNGLYGFDDVSYVWYGFGLYTQLWGMILLPPALACGYTAIRDGRGYFLAVLLLSATLLSHLVLAYIGLSSLVLLTLLMPPPPALRTRLGRLALVLGLTALVTSYFLVPFIRDGAYMNRGVWELQTKYDAFGYEWTLRSLAGGRLFDYGRFPSLSLLLAAGVAVCAWRWNDARYRIPLLLGGLWLALYFGRPTWGVLLNLLPLSENMQFHRLIAGVHLAGIMLAGIALGVPWRWALERRQARWLVAVAAVTAAILAPAYLERRHYFEKNAESLRISAAQYSREERDINALEARLRALPPGRVYAGRANNWGGDYRVGGVPMDALLSSAGFDMSGYLYHSLSFNADELILLDETRPDQYNLFNIRYVVAPAGHAVPAFVTPIGDFGRHRLYRVDTTGYFDIVGSDATFTGDKSEVFTAASTWMASDLPAKKEHPAISLEGGGGRTFNLSRSAEILRQMSFDAGPSRGMIVSERTDGDIYAASVDIARPSMVMLKATFHPGWHATVDGVPVPTLMLMPSYVAVPVRSGTHNVRFEYRAPKGRLPLLLFGLALLPAIGVAEWRRRELVDFMTRRLPARRSNFPRSVDRPS